MLIRYSLMLSFVSLVALMTGCCCGPGAGGCGPCPGNCNDCDDAGFGRIPVACGPLGTLANVKRSIVCGGGCGEAYYGEWTSSPPDACDPCCGSDFGGGARPCVPFCWRPGLLFGCVGGLYGKRFCDGCGNAASQCGCDFSSSCGDSSCGDGSCGDGSCGGDCNGGGCSTCNSGQANSSRIASPPPKVDPNHRTARAQAVRRGLSSLDSGLSTRYR